MFSDSTFETIAALPGWRAARCAKAFGIYEDYPTGARLFEFYRCLAKFLIPHCELRSRGVPVSDLSHAETRHFAATEAASADLVVISVHRGRIVPAELEDWLKLWCENESKRRSVLAAIFDVGESKTNPLVLHLAELAAEFNLEFLMLPNEPQL